LFSLFSSAPLVVWNSFQTYCHIACSILFIVHLLQIQLCCWK
jgi:hypothetical protein